MSGIPRDDFDSLARRYWAAWGDALRSAVPGTGTMPGTGGAWPQPPGVDAWQESLDWWTRLAHGGRTQANDALEHFNSQARQWYARMQEVAARFAGQESSASDVARAWKEALGASGENPFPEMLRSMRGHGLQGLEQWVDDASPWLDAVRDEGMSWLRLPAFGAGREQQERLQALAAHVAEYQQASSAYAALMLKAQQEAFVIFEAGLIDREEPGRQIQSARALFDLWIDAAEEAYAEIALSPEFREVYGRLVNAQMRVRASVQRMVEDACAQLGMPTRSELDGAHRKLAQLEREIRRLRDAGATGGPAAERAARTASRPPAKRSATAASGPVAKRSTSAPAKPAAGRSTTAATRPAAKRSTAATNRPAAKPSAAGTSRPAAKRQTPAIARPAAKRAAAGKAGPAAKRSTVPAAKRAGRKTGGRTPAGRGFGGAIAGAMPHAPEPIASDSTKKSVKKGRR
jgi:class III poly(R)-hydroxyalkanoic acid synthase PhaE subunit